MELGPGRFFKRKPPDPEQQSAHDVLIGGISDRLRQLFPNGVPTDLQVIADKINLPAELVSFGDIQEAIKRANAIDPDAPKTTPPFLK